jgi:light-regulated signal transduction histidine kinase (bacteriophytochrome)
MAGTNAIAIASYFSYILRMSEMATSLENTKDLAVYRRLLVLAGVIYLLWWFAVDSLLHGLGIAPEFVERIFDRFDRFERAISARNISGLGLGLYTARQIVEAHHGRVTVKSELGQGSVFTVNLPLRKEKT